jgi:N-acetylneuraminate synthase
MKKVSKSNLDDFFFIAEIGVNHEGSIDLAKKMIKEVASAGAHAAKFQTYKADLISAKESPAYWDLKKEPTKSQNELFKKYDNFEKKDYELLKKECEKYGIQFMSTPFDIECLHWLIPLMKVVKIASADITNNILLEEVSKYKKPMILSVGASTDDEIIYAVNFLIKNGIKDITLLHCMLLYPTSKDLGFLHRINEIKKLFQEKINIKVGYSDHISPHEADNDQLLVARALGASVIEKHFTFNKNLSGNDHYHALDKNDLKKIIKRLKNLDSMISNKQEFQKKGLSIQKEAILNARRSLFYSKNLSKGSTIKKEHLIAKRPGQGISPKFYESLIGKKIIKDVKEDQIISYSDFEKLS